MENTLPPAPLENSDTSSAAPMANISYGPEIATEPATKAIRLDPTRYGDWELNGKCVDF